MSILIVREIEPDIVRTLPEKPITILYGPRQVGKTTLVKKLLLTAPKSRYFQCDDPADRAELEHKSIAELQALLSGYSTVVIDEAQRVPDIGTTLKLIADSMPHIHLIATGSSSFELANKINEPLTGRNRKYYLYPFTVREMLTTQQPQEFSRTIEQYLRYGMYPSVVNLQTSEEKERELVTLAQDYLYRDLLSYNGIKNSHLLEKLLRLLALQVGSEISYTKLATDLGVARDTVYSYVTILEQAFIIFRITPFFTNKVKEVVKTHKIYFWDIGMRNAVLGNFLGFETREDKGAVFENFFIAERYKRAMYDQKNVTLHFWRTHNGTEIDLIESYDGGTTIKAFECKWKDTVSAPISWAKAYPEAAFVCVTKDTCTGQL